MKKRFIHSILSTEDLDGISKAIEKVEKETTGEIKIVVRERRHLGEKRLSFERMALREFRSLKLWRTKERTAILFFLLLSERKFHIVADEGIHRKVAEGTWEGIAQAMGAEFKTGKFRDGLMKGLELVGAVLSENFPSKRGGRNEIPDKIVVER